MENIIIPPPIITINGGDSFINIQAHTGPRIASTNINMPTIAAGVFFRTNGNTNETKAYLKKFQVKKKEKDLLGRYKKLLTKNDA